jgi:hypothetical protein
MYSVADIESILARSELSAPSVRNATTMLIKTRAINFGIGLLMVIKSRSSDPWPYSISASLLIQAKCTNIMSGRWRSDGAQESF